MVAGAVAQMLGRGGKTAVAEASGMSRNTVIKAVGEIAAGVEPTDRQRAIGGGDKPAVEKQPGLLAAFDELVHPDTWGNPMSSLRWTSKSTVKLVLELVRQGFEVSDDTVGRILKRLGYSLQSPVKVKDGSAHPDRDGQFRYPHGFALQFADDAGGSNGHRVRAWKAELACLAAETGLEITACHYPPGTSKWNRIEHRMFNFITMNWRGRPLTSYRTTTETGLEIRAERDTEWFAKVVKITDVETDALQLHRHERNGDWNFTLAVTPIDIDEQGRRRAETGKTGHIGAQSEAQIKLCCALLSADVPQ